MVQTVGNSTTTTTPLTVDGLSFAYEADQPVVLEDFSAELHGGQVTALIGPNAAGKTTLLRLMLGQLTPLAGGVRLQGRPVASYSPARRAGLMSYVPQRAGVSFGFTVREVVGMGRFALPPDEAAVEHALEACDLVALGGRTFTALSVGQQQRVLLARAVAQAGGMGNGDSAERETGDGKIMLLDEPGSAMDLWHTHRTMRLLCDLAHRRGMAILVVVHDLNLAARYADRIWLLDGGRLLAQGPWDEVMRPEVLDPVYRVKLSPLHVEQDARPVFHVGDVE